MSLQVDAITPPRISERVSVRFGATLMANVLRAGFSFVTGLMIARFLGAANYGDLNFLLGSFAALAALLDMGATPAFYTFISRRPRSRAFFALYFAWIIVFQFVVTALAVAVFLPHGAIERIWLGHDRQIILLALGGSFAVTQLWGIVSQLGEATRRTVVVQSASIIQAATHLLLVVAAGRLGLLSVRTVFWLQIFEYVFIAAVLGPMLLRKNVADEPQPDSGWRDVAAAFVAYCKPLVVYGSINCIYSFANRWLLQNFGGSTQQGFFSIGQQFANISLLATTSILNVFWKEVAAASENGDKARLKHLYVTARQGLYSVGALASCLLIPYSREILAWTVGAGYSRAANVLTLMFLYPVHQALGQIQATFFYATAQTATYTRIAIFMMAVSLPITYFLLAPPAAALPGLGLGALGLTIAMVTLQIVTVSLQTWSLSRVHGWKTDFGYQAVLLIVLLGVAFGSKFLVQSLLPASLRNSPSTVIAGALMYLLVAFVVLLGVPQSSALLRDLLRRFRQVERVPGT